MAETAPARAPASQVAGAPDCGRPCPEPPQLREDERFELMGLLLAAHSRLTKVLGAELEESCGLPLSWYDVLLRLYSAPDQRLTIGQLGEGVFLTSGGITRLVDRIEEAGLVERKQCPSDRRAVHVALTRAGVRRLNDATSAHLDSLDRHLMRPLTANERQVLAAALGKLSAGEHAACST